jgi:hypothetical protein
MLRIVNHTDCRVRVHIADRSTTYTESLETIPAFCSYPSAVDGQPTLVLTIQSIERPKRNHYNFRMKRMGKRKNAKKKKRRSS